nr:zonadhesin-like [Pogona vitticeps]
MQSSAWLPGSVTAQIPVQRPFKVAFVATRAETKDIDMALDTVSLRLGPCSPCVTGCDFDRLDDLCGWENPAEGDVQWEQWTGPGDEDGVGPEDDFSRPGFGFYMLLDSLNPNGDGAALLKSPTYHSLGGCLALSFHYTLHGVSNSTALNVYAAAVPGGELGSPLLTLRGEHGPDWNLGAINYTGTATVQFVLEGIYRGKPGLAVDSVRISPCEEIFAQCDFNDNANPFCGWVSSGAGNHTWTRTNQSTPTEETGPPGDYPHGEGYYIYAEGGSLQPGQSVVLSSRPFCAETDACVEFFYHMSGIVEVDTQLRVLLEGPSGATALLWTRTGIQSPGWLLGSVTAPYGGPQPSRVLFEVIRGSNPYLDVALDNLSVRRGPCAAATGTPAPPATSAVATLTQAGPAGTVPPAPPTTCLPTSTSRTTQATPAAATPQGSTVSRPQTTAFRSTAGGATGSTLGASSTSTRPEVPHGSSPATTVTLATSPTSKTTATGHFGSSSAGPASSSRTTTGHPGSTHTTRHNSPGATSISTTPVRTTSSPSISVGPTYPPSPGHPSGSSPGATVGPTSHATNPISQPLTAASSRATTLSSHSTVSTSQTMTTGGHSSTSHTSAVKTTPSSVVASTLTTTTTTSIAPPAVSTTMTTTNVPPSTVSSAASPATNTTAATTSSISTARTQPPSTGPTTPSHASSSSPGATVGPTSHATAPISHPLTATSSRATTLSSHSTLDTSQTSATGGHSSTGHTSAVKTTPSSVAASTLTLSTATTTSIAPPALSTATTTTNVQPSTVSSAASPATNTTAATTSSISTARTQPPSTGPTTPSHASSSSPGATVGPTSHATAPISHPLTATSSRATTLSSHSTLDTSQTSATGGHSSTGHTSAVKTTPSSVATSTLTTSSSSSQPSDISTMSATTGHASAVTSHAAFPTNTTTATTTSSISTARTQPPSTGPTTPSHASSQPLTAASSRATTLSSHSTLDTSQTSATGGHSSTGHTSAVKTTPSSVAASTLTTSSSSSQPSNISTMSATTGHASTVTSHAAFPTTVSSLTSLNTHQATTTHRSPSTGHTSAHQTASSQVTRGTTPSISSHATSTGAVGHTSRATTAGDSRLTTTTTTAISLGPNTTSSASLTSQAGHGTSSATTSLANYTTTPSTPATGPNTEPASKPANSSAIPSGPSHVGTTSGTTAQAKPTTAGPTSPLASSQKATTLTTPGHSEPPHSSTTSSTHGGPTSPYATSTTGHGQPFSTSSPPPNYSSSHPATISHAIPTTSPTATVGHVNATSTSRGTPAATRPVSTAPASTHSSPTTSGLTNTNSSHASVTTTTASHADTTHSTPHAVPGTTPPATNHTAGASSPTTVTKITSPGTTTTGLVVTTTPGAEPRTTTTKLPPTPEASTRSTITSTAPVAPPEQEICTISGDPHYTTYDGRLFHFMGTCTYLLSAVCNATSGLPLFQVQATNEHRGANTQVSYVKSVRVEVYGIQIVLLKGRRVTVDGQRVTLPVSVAEGKVSVRLSGTFALVQTDFGLWVRFDGNHHVEVSAPSSYIGQLCGLCGNYNGQGADDNLMPDGTSAGTDADRLGESWQVPNAEDSPGCTNTGNPGECDQDIKTEAEKPASCGILTDPNGPFAPCHSKVPPDGAFENCVYDLCGTGGDASILCFALQSYADRCAQAGVPIAWRNSSFCPLNCPTGSSYTPCGPACPATCTGSSTSCPNMPCVEGCVCDEGMVLSGDHCVPLAQCGCTDPQGQYHPVGENWMGNEDCSRRCTCGPLNNITCEEWSCSPVQECRRVDGLLGCQDMGVAACHVAGDPHYYTFDGTMVSFMGTCTYTLVTVCDDDPHLPSFNITGKNEERGQPDESYLRQVTVEVAGHTITLQKARRVLIDGLRVRTPVEGRVPGVSITTSGIYVFLETDFGLVVKFDGNHHLEIQLPGTYFEKVCGMCGNFNNESLDDLLMPNGHLATNASQFGNSWKAPGDQDPGCQPDDREDLEPHCSSEEKDRLHALCREILQPKYQACHNIINPQLFIQNCLYDMCEYQGMASVLCDNIQSYVEACKSQGVTGISWRNSTFCPLPCPSHSRYTECASPCPATCSNLYAPASCQRSTTCVEGCTCEPGYVLSDNNCVAMRDCGCVDSQQDYYSPGDTWVTSNCRERCTCAGNGTITCQDFQCLSGSFCTLSSAGLRYCRPTQFHQCVISGDPHYRTFDHFVHHFQGRSTYTLTQTLGSLPEALVPLSVAGRNRRRLPFQRFSFLREVYVSVYGYQITLMQGRHMAVNGLRITPPYHAPDDRLQITQRGRKLIVQTDFGFSVSFDGQDLAEIVLPTTYQDHVGGLCGNYDGRRSNEYMKPDGTWTRSLNTFGNSWQVSVQREVAASGHVRARREEEPTEEAESGFEVDCSPEQLMLVNGTDNCGALSDPQGPFAACHSIISPDTFQESCVYDLCALFNDSELLCQDYNAYAQLCQEEGVTLGPWRQATGCEISCPVHSTYQSCMSACPASCANMAAPSDCQAPCVEGCASDPGYLLSGLEVVPYNQCGCTSNDQYYQINDTFLTDNCSQRCTCRNTGTLECEAAGCPEGQICTVANYTRGCFRASPCLSSPCQNEGTCVESDGPEGFTCSCLESYTGPLCEEAPLDVSPTNAPNTTLVPIAPEKEDNHLVAILTGIFVPLGVILIVVMTVCFCRRRRNRMKKEEDRLDVLSSAVQPSTSDAVRDKITPF